MKVKRAVGGQEQVNGRGKGLFLSHWMNWLLLQRSIKSHYHLKTSNPAKRLEPFNHCLSARSIRSRLVIESDGMVFCFAGGLLFVIKNPVDATQFSPYKQVSGFLIQNITEHGYLLESFERLVLFWVHQFTTTAFSLVNVCFNTTLCHQLLEALEYYCFAQTSNIRMLRCSN